MRTPQIAGLPGSTPLGLRLVVGARVRNTFSGDIGTVDRTHLGPGLLDCVLVRFHDRNGHPHGDGLCVPRSQLEVMP